MKKIVTFILLLSMVSSITACSDNTNHTESPETTVQTEAVESTENSNIETTQPQITTPTKLTNKMTDNELQLVDKHELTLLDEYPKPNADPQAEHKVSIEFQTMDTKELRKNLEDYRDEITDAEYEHEMKLIQEAEENGEDYLMPLNFLVDGYLAPYLIPTEGYFTDGIPFSFTTSIYNENGKLETERLTFYTFEEYLDYIRDKDTECGYPDELIEMEIMYTQIAYNALKSGDYETLPEGTIDRRDEKLNLWNVFHNYRSDWEFDREAVEEIKDSVDEISIFDDELSKDFTVHVILPPDYDKDKTYPVFFLTDGIWRFGNCPELRKCMENGEAAPVILVSLYYSYYITDPDQGQRYEDLVINRSELLDFITDNLMPYLCENYNIDCANSTLYGHSDGGVFTHNALFNSDKYENQPFGNYIIGSPAFWGLNHYNEYEGISNDIYMNDYGYFDRNDTLNKTVFLCAGSQEDPDYADNYRDGDYSTLEGVAKLQERLEAHNADMTYKLYESHHYQYIPEMLIEYLKKTYPC